jgi:predicted RND superfamily exporter protein
MSGHRGSETVPQRGRFARWLPIVLLGLPIALAWATFRWISLIPQVDQRFFFTPGSPIYRAHQKIERRYEGQELLVVIATGDISSREYRRRIDRLGDRLLAVRGVTGVRSLTSGPDDLEDARESPLWRRLLLPDDGRASNLILIVAPTSPAALIDGVQGVLRKADTKGFRLELAGVPYVVDAIRRNLQRDFRTFNLAAAGLFAVVVFALFRSFPILIGSLVACTSAVFATLMAQQWLGGRIGLLTANIVTIAFVLTQSHVVFMSNNWRKWRASCATPEEAVRRAIRRTFVASLWCMSTALLGFGSLLYVEAQPLRELGFGGLVATVVALAAAYLIFPPFLLWARAPEQGAVVPAPAGRRLWLPGRPVAALILLACLAVGFGARYLDTDPSLLEYFGAGSDVRRSLEIVDRNGGSSPLNIAVRRKDGERLDTSDSYEHMWKLQHALQRDPAVGTVLSLPVLMAEADRAPLAKLLTWNWVLDILSRPEFDRVAEGFVNEERTEALFMLRMVEEARKNRRTEVVQRLQGIVAKHGFTASLTGGIYALQGRLADLVADSLYEGLAALLVACTLIALILTRSLWAGVAMMLCCAAIPAVTLGLAGFLRVPLDIVVSPAINVAVGVAVDSMIHLGAAWRRARERGEGVRAAQREQAPGIFAFFVVVTAGFAIFLLSNFPPTQRFGLAVVVGTAVAAVMALWVFPGLLGEPREATRSSAGT